MTGGGRKLADLLVGRTWGVRGRRVQDGSPSCEGYAGKRHVWGREKEYARCLQSVKPVCYYRTHWPVVLCCLLSGTWHHRNPLKTLAAALTYQFSVGKETGVSLPSHLSVHLSVHPLSICSPDMTCVSNLSQTQPMDSAGSKHSADFPPPGALTAVTDSPTSPSSFCSHPQVSDSQVPPSLKCGSDCLPVPRELSPP